MSLTSDLRLPTSDLRPLTSSVKLRRFPYPYCAMLAICSDLDETADAEVYGEQMRFLNTRETTAMGEGVGLEVGNTIYFDMPPGQFAYWNTDDRGREMVRALIRSGHVDCLHSYGDLATTRAHAARALEELARHGLELKVWIDHAVAPTNFGADIMCGHGDEPGHPAYHADLTLAHGVRYVWRGRVTSIIGQDHPINLAHLISDLCPLPSVFRSPPSSSSSHSLSSRSALLKEAAKQLLGRAGNGKYAFHAANRVCSSARLRDGGPVIEFLRCNPHPQGLDFGDTGTGIGEVMTSDFLDRLVEREGFCILYTHLGKLPGRQFDKVAAESFRLLARYQEERKVLVTTTRRLLEYRNALEELVCRASIDSRGPVIDIETPVRRDGARAGFFRTALDGLTFYASDGENTRVRFNGREITETVTNPPDETARPSLSVPWGRLTFPSL